jgi:hypothetical protein
MESLENSHFEDGEQNGKWIALSQDRAQWRALTYQCGTFGFWYAEIGLRLVIQDTVSIETMYIVRLT